MKNGIGYSLIILIINISCGPDTYAAAEKNVPPGNRHVSEPQELQGRNPLMNGRIWHNRYPRVAGNPFYLSDRFLEGSVTFNGKKFKSQEIKYDIASDELILKSGTNPVIMLNKEMVDSFDLLEGNRRHKVINFGNDTLSPLKGYVNVLYSGPSSLFVKYSKKIRPLALDGKTDLFHQEHRIFMKNRGNLIAIKSKRQFFNALREREHEIRSFVRKEKMKLSVRDPFTLVPVLSYFDNPAIP